MLTTEMGKELTAARPHKPASYRGGRRGTEGCETGLLTCASPQDTWMPDHSSLFPFWLLRKSQGETGKEATEGGDFRLPLPRLLASISTSTSPREAATVVLLDEQSVAML